METLVAEPLTREAFAPFGQVLETEGASHFPINEGTTTRFHALSSVETGAEGRAIVSIFRGTFRGMPFPVSMLERHPLGSQAFMPLSPDEWLVVVAERPDPAALRCFRARGNQGVQYARGTWHHPLLVLVAEQDFLIVDRDGPGSNLEEVQLSMHRQVGPQNSAGCAIGAEAAVWSCFSRPGHRAGAPSRGVRRLQVAARCTPRPPIFVGGGGLRRSSPRPGQRAGASRRGV